MATSKSARVRLPKEAVQFAKKMGISLDGLEPEAEEIWKMLDDMSNSDPMQYQNFVSQQLRDGPDAKSDQDSERRSFRPDAGFVVRTETTGGDGIMIRETEGGKNIGKLLYINVCGSKVVEEPVDSAGKSVTSNILSVSDVSIPLAVGESRDHDDGGKCLAVDVVVCPVVLDTALRQPHFQRQLVDLSIVWIQKEREIQCTGAWSVVEGVKYCAGRGGQGDVPVLFFVESGEKPASCQDKNTSIGSKGSLDTSAGLLTALKQEKEDRGITSLDPIAVVTPSNSGIGRSTLIQDITPVSDTEQKKQHPQQVQQPKRGNDFDKKAAAAFGNLNRPTEKDSSTLEASKSSAPALPAPSITEYRMMADIMSNMDEGFKTGGGANNLPREESGEAMIADLARMLTGSGALNDCANQPSAQPPIIIPENSKSAVQIINEAPELLSVNYKDINPGSQSSLTISGLKSTLDASKIDLLMSGAEIVVRISSHDITVATIGSLEAAVPTSVKVGVKWRSGDFRFDPKGATASFKKKKGCLLVNLLYSKEVQNQ